jgi:hypothetical protein
MKPNTTAQREPPNPASYRKEPPNENALTA